MHRPANGVLAEISERSDFNFFRAPATAFLSYVPGTTWYSGVYCNVLAGATDDYLMHVHVTTVIEILVDNASVPAGGPFIGLMPAGGLFIFLPLVDNASVTAGGPFKFCSTLLDVKVDVSLQLCHR